jgi:hypothetical protein
MGGERDGLRVRFNEENNFLQSGGHSQHNRDAMEQSIRPSGSELQRHLLF